MLCLGPVLATVLAASGAPAADRVVVAVFDIESKGVELSSDVLARLSSYGATRLASTNTYAVVPREQIREQLETKKAESYKNCYDPACQIEIGKEVAAQKSLASSVMRLGSRCVVSLALYDLRTSATEKATTAEGGCAEDDVFVSMKSALSQLAEGASAPSLPEPTKVAAEQVPEVDVGAWSSGFELSVLAGGAVIPTSLNAQRLLYDAAGPAFVLEGGRRFDLGAVYLRPKLSLEAMPLEADSSATNLWGAFTGLSVIFPIARIVEIEAGALAGLRLMSAQTSVLPGSSIGGPKSYTDFSFAADGGVLVRATSSIGGRALFRYSDEQGMTVVSVLGGVTIVL
jgi:hypothetical protein